MSYHQNQNQITVAYYILWIAVLFIFTVMPVSDYETKCIKIVKVPQVESIPQVQLYQLTGYIVDFMQVGMSTCLKFKSWKAARNLCMYIFICSYVYGMNLAHVLNVLYYSIWLAYYRPLLICSHLCIYHLHI